MTSNSTKSLVVVIFLPVAVASSYGNQKEEAKPKILVNPAGDIQVIADRNGTFVEFFQKQRILVGGLQRDKAEMLTKAEKPTEKVFINYASYNHDKTMTALFGATVTIAPLRDDAKKLLADQLDKNKKAGVTLILRRDAKEATYHVVGVTTRSSVGFFTQEKRVGKDDFSQKDLMHDPFAK